MEGNTMKYSSIGWAINSAMAGHKMKRKGWTNSIDWIAYVPKGSVSIPQKFADGADTGPFLVAKLKYSEKLVPWTVTQADLLAEDWQLAEPVQPGEYHLDPPAAQPAQ